MLKKLGGAVCALAMLAGGAAAPVGAQALKPSLELASAEKVVAACKAWGEDHDLQLSIVVLDESRQMVAFARMDGAAPGTVELAQWKARGSGAFRYSSMNMTKVDATLAAAPGIAGIGGGEPIFTKEGAPLGSVGVSGAPTMEADADCARAGIEAAGLATGG